jgi:tryptophan-rich sensory protein
MSPVEPFSGGGTARLRAVLVWLVFLAIVFAVAAVGAQFSPGPWYAALDKPPWTPPNGVFAPVWTALYVMVATAGALVWLRPPRDLALALWTLQLALNALWSFLFFGLERPGLAALDIAALLVAILATTAAFWRVSRLAAVLMLPYAAWVAFATALNVEIWRLNA